MTYSRETGRSDTGYNPVSEETVRRAWMPPSVTRLAIRQTAGGSTGFASDSVYSIASHSN
jgi:hypothetical protein